MVSRIKNNCSISTVMSWELKCKYKIIDMWVLQDLAVGTELVRVAYKWCGHDETHLK